MRTSDFDFDLPPELIAQEPLSDRTAARLMDRLLNNQPIEDYLVKLDAKVVLRGSTAPRNGICEGRSKSVALACP